MAKGRTNKDDFEEVESEGFLTDLDYENIADSITKKQLVGKIHEYILDPYICKFSSKQPIDIKPAEFMKGVELITKLLGFDKETTEDLPDEIELKL